MASTAFPSRDDFAALLNESLGGENEAFEGKVVTGTVTGIENDLAVIDVGLKSEGRVPLREFAMPGQKAELKIGDTVEVYVDRVENSAGEAMLSRDRARREAAWDKLEKEHEKGERVEGVIFGRVKGGFTVDLGGAVAFLPGSQVDIRPVRDVGPLMDMPQPFQILKMDRRRGNIVVSRRAVLEETRAEQRSELIDKLTEGQVMDGVVKNITDYGAFVDLGGIDGLLHVTDIAWRRVNHPSEVLSIGQTVEVVFEEVPLDIEHPRRCAEDGPGRLGTGEHHHGDAAHHCLEQRQAERGPADRMQVDAAPGELGPAAGPRSANCELRVSAARWLSVPGSETLSLVCGRTCPDTTINATASTSHSGATTTRWRTQKRPRR